MLILLLSGLLQPVAAAGADCARENGSAPASQQSSDPSVLPAAAQIGASSVGHQQEAPSAADDVSVAAAPCGSAAALSSTEIAVPDGEFGPLVPSGTQPPASIDVGFFFRPPRLS